MAKRAISFNLYLFIYSLVKQFLETHFHKNNYRSGYTFWKKKKLNFRVYIPTYLGWGVNYTSNKHWWNKLISRSNSLRNSKKDSKSQTERLSSKNKRNSLLISYRGQRNFEKFMKAKSDSRNQHFVDHFRLDVQSSLRNYQKIYCKKAVHLQNKSV